MSPMYSVGDMMWVNPLVKEGKTIDEVDVSCGATYGAKLVRDMVNEAKEVASKY